MTLDDLAQINLAELYWEPTEPTPQFLSALLARTKKDPDLRTAGMIMYHVYRAAHRTGHTPTAVLEYVLSPEGKMKAWRDFAQHWTTYLASDQRKIHVRMMTRTGTTADQYIGWMHDGYTRVLDILDRLQEEPTFRQKALAVYDAVGGNVVEGTLEKRELPAPQ